MSKGIFIPDITVEMIRKAPLEAIETLLVEGEMHDVDMPKWIPCSERLPEELSVVNVTWVNHDPAPYYDFVKDIAFTETAVYYRGDWYWNWSGCVDVLAEYGRDDANKVDKAVEVIAWMPLPEPWKGVANERQTERFADNDW